MTDVHGRSTFAGNAPKIAIGAAVAALLTSVIAVIVVATRGGGGGGGAPEPTSTSTSTSTDATAPAGRAGPPEQRVAASDVVKLKRETVSVVRDAGKVIGVKVTDRETRTALGLEADDVITALSGRALKREFDVFDAMLGMSQLDASLVYVDLLRDHKPVLLRWRLDGNLRAARRAETAGSLGSLSSRGGLGSLGGQLGPNPYYPGLGSLGGGSTVPDPLVDTITKLDDRSYEVPRATVDRVFSSTSTYARIARTLPSYRSEGFRVYGVRSSTLVSAIGIQNGDAVRAINGHEVNTIEEALELYDQIKGAKEWRIDITRRGRPELITIAIK